MDAKLSVEVGAKIDQLMAGMVQAEKAVSNFVVNSDGKLVGFGKSISVLERQLRSFQNGLKNTTDPTRIDILNRAIDITNSKLKQTGQVINGANLKGLSAGSNQAAFALTNLGRVAQDAPFGFIGIQNNLNPLLESFQRLKAETGTTGAALKALGSSLLGPAGLGVALSLVTAGLVLYTQWQQKSAKATENASKADEDYAKSLDDVSRAQLVGAEKAQDELVTLKLLYDRTQDVTLSNKARNKAADELQKMYPSILGNVSNEAILAGKASDKYNLLAESILATARAQAARDLISKNQQKILENESKLVELETEKLEKQIAANKLAKSVGSGAGQGFGGSQNTAIALQNVNAQSKVNDVIDLQNKLKEENNKLDANNLLLIKSVNAEIAKGGQLDGKEGAKDKIKSSADVLGDLSRELQKIEADVTGTFGDKSQDKINAYKKAINGLIDIGVKPASTEIKKLQETIIDLQADIDIGNIKLPKIDIKSFSEPFQNLPVVVQQQLRKTQVIIDEFTKSVDAILSGGLLEGIGNIAGAIGSALANGNNALQAGAGALLGTLGDIMIQLGKLAIQTGIGIQAIKTALKSLNPAVAIAAGVALITLGSVVKGAASNIGGGGNERGTTGYKKIPGFADGVQNFRGGVALVGERGPEILQLPTGSNIIPNHKISGIGSGQIEFGDIKLSGQDLYISWKRTQKLNERVG